MADFKAQMNRPFEQEARLKGLLAKQDQLNAALDLDTSETQVVAEDKEPEEKRPGFIGRVQTEGRETVASRL